VRENGRRETGERMGASRRRERGEGVGKRENQLYF